jgi:hypothetical protein
MYFESMISASDYSTYTNSSQLVVYSSLSCYALLIVIVRMNNRQNFNETNSISTKAHLMRRPSRKGGCLYLSLKHHNTIEYEIC